MKVFAIVVFAAVWASSNAQGYQPQMSYQLAAPAPHNPPAPIHSSYQPPVYTAKPSYGPVQVGAPVPHTYPSPAPPVPCPTNLLLSCAPSVAPVPCQSVHYEKPSHAPPPPPPPTYTKPAPFPSNF